MAVSAYATIVPDTPLVDTSAGCSDADEVLLLFRAHGDALYRLARVMVREASEAEDVVQDAFVRLLAHLSANGDRSNIKSWLFTVTANLCRDRLRRRLRWLPWVPAYDRLLQAQPELDARDPQDVFVAAMRGLAPRDRLLLMLKAQGLSYRAISAAAGVREASVGRLLARALARWQKAREATSHG
jgi:RNA polymerase sigma-70 factor (ECF subfamily)